jgi:ketosteroid isomerase-like protein
MDSSSLRSQTVRRTVEAVNQGHLDDFLALFAPDATLVDVATYQGQEAIREWAERETFGVRMRFRVEREANVDGTRIEGSVHSVGGYSGPSTWTSTLRGETIERLVIE